MSSSATAVVQEKRKRKTDRVISSFKFVQNVRLINEVEAILLSPQKYMLPQDLG